MKLRLQQLSPRIYMGETVYSIVARMVLSDLSASVTAGIENILGNRNLQIDSALPSFLNQLAQTTYINFEELLHQFSLFPYLSAFASPDVKRKAQAYLLQGDSSGAHKALGFLASRLPEETVHWFCPRCANEQMITYGETFWLRGHQLPLVTVCISHSCNLHTKPRQRKHITFPDPNASFELNHSPLAQKIALVSQWFLNGYDLNGKQLRRCYAARLMHLGFATAKSLSLRKWTTSMRTYYLTLMTDSRVKAVFQAKGEHGFPANVFYYDKASHHPIKHILIICHLFEHEGDFLMGYSQAAMPMKRCSQVPTQPLQPDIDEKRRVKVVEALHQKVSLRSVMKIAGVSAATARNIANEVGITLASRARKLTKHTLRTIKIKLMTGHATKQIASELRVRINDVEQVLTGAPDMKLLRQRIRQFKLRKDSRHALLNVVNKTPNFRVKDSKEQCYSSYMWLYKNDNQWLKQVIESTKYNQQGTNENVYK